MAPRNRGRGTQSNAEATVGDEAQRAMTYNASLAEGTYFDGFTYRTASQDEQDAVRLAAGDPDAANARLAQMRKEAGDGEQDDFVGGLSDALNDESGRAPNPESNDQ